MLYPTDPAGVRTGIPYRSWNVIRNVGDAITPYIIELLTGQTPYYGREDEEHLLAVGSILFMANPKSSIWGSGILGPHIPNADLKASQFHAVRGTRTADVLLKAGIVLNDIPFGDPGIFADEVLRKADQPCSPSTGRPIAIVPHHSSFKHHFVQRLIGSSEVCVVDVCDDSLIPLQLIADCEIVISQSLHGLIFAESFGKPALWIGDSHDEGACFKYWDWYTTTENPQPVPLSFDTPLESMVKMAVRQHSKINREELRKTFPLAATAKNLAKPIFDFRTCRQTSPFVFFAELVASAPVFFEQAKARMDVLFERWAERPYALALDKDTGILPNPAQLQLISYAMDKMFRTDFAILAPRAVLEALGGAEENMGLGVFRFKTPPETITTMLLRPLYERPAVSYVVFGI